MNDLNMCSSLTGGQNNKIQFAKNWQEKCKIDLNSWIDNELAKGMGFVSLYIDYWENSHRMIKTVPVLVRDAFHRLNNEEEVEEWQLVKRFMLIDVLSGKNFNFKEDLYQVPKFNQQFNFVRYAKNIELRFKVHDQEKRPNKISVPLLIIDYGLINATDLNIDESIKGVEFHFKVVFSKHFSFDYLLEVNSLLIQ